MGLFKIFNETLDAAGVFANEVKMVGARWTKKNNITLKINPEHVQGSNTYLDL